MAPAAQQPREHVSAGVAAGPSARSQVRDVGPAHQTSPEECRSDLDLVGVVLDGLSAWCAHRPGLAALSRVLGDDASAAPTSSPASRGALEQLQRQPHRAGIDASSRRWFRIGHGREQYYGPTNHDAVTVRSSRTEWLTRPRILKSARSARISPEPDDGPNSTVSETRGDGVAPARVHGAVFPVESVRCHAARARRAIVRS